jgi:hypothetical protein
MRKLSEWKCMESTPTYTPNPRVIIGLVQSMEPENPDVRLGVSRSNDALLWAEWWCLEEKNIQK